LEILGGIDFRGVFILRDLQRLDLGSGEIITLSRSDEDRASFRPTTIDLNTALSIDGSLAMGGGGYRPHIGVVLPNGAGLAHHTRIPEQFLALIGV
jgi:hypothetical protein